MSKDWKTILPLPWGEGRGEGEGSDNFTRLRMNRNLIVVVLAVALLTRASAATDISNLKSPIRKPHWSFQPVRNWPLPKVQNSTWPRSSIDRFILEKIEQLGFQPAPPADKRTLIRRASFDLLSSRSATSAPRR